jgi:hypothetical protein
MLSAYEFTVGTLESAAPLSLLLPRTKYEASVLVGHGENGPVAVVLSGQFAFYRLETRGSENWKGLIVPNVRVEVDEGSLFSPDHEGNTLGAVLRLDTRLVVSAKDERYTGRAAFVCIYNDLAPTGEHKAGFRRWHVVIGQGTDKQVLWQTPEANS